ncbi:diguanylate cyclase (GGDEF)-like protein [Novosphingobium chloroacetimidivorans]|uniref:Diguanylate cyclase (GGDEF)-like protein n=1 Tax=Novosphingobium chloroacetimidivorans TaxID=1428314 RepID=A0A7W7KD63_9SPHN|nr:EAL domain-containing protein [Novosphingobium chloroacetimidivorans]MBB4860109.1 diguanylate cyclase (GGDEF)-like protein [Novosphingobium chloroacetimidivorans]
MPRRILPKVSPPPETGSADEDGRVSRERSTLHFGSLRARIAVILASLFGMLVGTLVVLFAVGIMRIDSDAIGATVSQSGLLLFVIGAAELMVVLALGIALARTITAPLADLLRATRSVSRGRKAHVQVESGDEIGKLAESFNAMVDAIEARERRITHVALHDALTGLPNRKYFVEQLDQALARRRDGARVLVAYIDLDDFKMVNDTLGHAAGDRLLCDVARQLQAELPEGVIARLSGDEFAAMIPAIPARADLAAFGMRLQGCFARDIVLDGRKAETSASIGIAVAPEDGAEASVLLKNADLALYRAKQQGKAGHHFFETALDERARMRRQLELDLRAAIRDGGFALHFQPLYSLSEERLTAFEALVRWPHPTLGLVAPGDFIPLAEETGLIMQIGEWVMREACRQAMAWPEPLSVAVNLSAKQFLSPALPAMVVHALAASGLPPQRLEVEITESAFAANVEKTLETLHALQGLGVRITLDDFGTGYTSLGHLRLFPFNKLKIDQSFVQDIAPTGNAHAVIRAITTLADALGIETLAEGVEEPSQLAVLRREGCQQIQGYLLSRPMDGAEVRAFIDDQRARASVIRLRA